MPSEESGTLDRGQSKQPLEATLPKCPGSRGALRTHTMPSATKTPLLNPQESYWLQCASLGVWAIRDRKFQLHEYSTRINKSAFGKFSSRTSSSLHSHLPSKTSDRKASLFLSQECWKWARFSISTCKTMTFPPLSFN